MSQQIDYFRQDYHVVAIDSRGHGKSELGDSPLAYRLIADDIAAVANSLSLKNVYVIGWSDGAITGLILGIEHPELIAKMALMSPNTRPDETAVDGTLIEFAYLRLDYINEMIAAGDDSEDWQRARQQLEMVLTKPNISQQELRSITAPTLIIAGDRDFINNSHTVELYESLTNAHLAILPNETHFTPVTNPTLFNSLVDNFLKSEFERQDSMDVLYDRDL